MQLTKVFAKAGPDIVTPVMYRISSSSGPTFNFQLKDILENKTFEINTL
jgi:hypothetical protein